MKQFKIILAVLLILTISGCAKTDRASTIKLSDENKDTIIEELNLSEEISKDDILSYNLDLNGEYKGIRIRIYEFKDDKWDLINNDLWKVKSLSANLAFINSKEKGLVLMLASSNAVRTETVLDTFFEYDKYDIEKEAEININEPIPLIACYKGNKLKKADYNDLKIPDEIKINDSDEYYILTITLE